MQYLLFNQESGIGEEKQSDSFAQIYKTSLKTLRIPSFCETPDFS